MNADRELRLPNGRWLRPGVEFTAVRGRKKTRLRYATYGVSPSTGRVYVSGREVGNRCSRHARTFWLEEITIVHSKPTEEHPFDLPKPRPRRGR